MPAHHNADRRPENPDDKTAPPPIDPHSWVELHGEALYRYALLHTGRPDAAEDAVQDALVAALRAKDRFSGFAAERTWLIGILKHKLIDRARESTRKQTLDAAADQLEEFFVRSGSWRVKPGNWGPSVLSQMERAEFWEAFTECLSGLSPAAACAFALREVDGVSSAEICELLAIRPANLWTIFHRARLQLRQCLENRWK